MKTKKELDREIELTKLIAFLAAGYPNSQMSDESIRVYRAMLSDIPIEVVNVAVQQCVAEAKFLPVPAELRDMCFRLTRTHAQELTGFEAWEVVRAAMGSIGSYRSPQFDNQLIARAVGCIGWVQLCRSENEVADRAHFVKVFEQLKERQQQEIKLLPVAREMRALADANSSQPKELRS